MLFFFIGLIVQLSIQFRNVFYTNKLNNSTRDYKWVIMQFSSQSPNQLPNIRMSYLHDFCQPDQENNAWKQYLCKHVEWFI